MPYAIKGKRGLKRIVAARVKQLFELKNFFDDTGYSCLGTCLHVEADYEAGLIKFDLLGTPIATADKTGEVSVIAEQIWIEDELGLDTLIEIMGDVLCMHPSRDYVL